MENETKFINLWFSEAFELDPLMTVAEWSDKYRILASSASSESGRWKTARTPYLREIMECLSPSHPAQEICFMKPTQVGATECGNNWFAYIVHQAPGAMIYVQPTVELAKRVSKQRIASTIEETPVLRERIKESRSRDSGNTILSKEFPGGIAIFTGANSAVGLRSMPAKYFYADEIDGWPQDVDGEGDPYMIAKKRTSTFAKRKIFSTSTPTMDITSRIEPLYKASDMRKFFLPCPECGEFQILEFENLVYESKNFELIGEVKYCCDFCETLIEEFQKTWMLEQGQWVAERPDRERVGFWINALYAPVGWMGWEEIVQEWLNATKENNPLLLKVFTNTVLAKTWTPKESKIEVSEKGLLGRREDYSEKIPFGVGVLTCAVDVQGDRLEAEVVGWGIDQESWGIEYAIFHGSPGKDKVWTDLDEFLQKTYIHDSGARLKIFCTLIDTGGSHTKRVYDFISTRQKRKIFGVKGSSQHGKPIVSKPKISNLNKIQLFQIGTDTAKELIYSRLEIEEPGSGYMHFPKNYDENYFKQLTAEVLVKIEGSKGQQTYSWQLKKGQKRNEALDIRVYNCAAIELIGVKNLAALVQKAQAGQVIFSEKQENENKKRRIISKGI